MHIPINLSTPCFVRTLNKGRYQQLQEERQSNELEEARNMTLARGVDDERMEERKKSVIRDGDPMALYAWKVSAMCGVTYALFSMQ